MNKSWEIIKFYEFITPGSKTAGAARASFSLFVHRGHKNRRARGRGGAGGGVRGPARRRSENSAGQLFHAPPVGGAKSRVASSAPLPPPHPPPPSRETRAVPQKYRRLPPARTSASERSETGRYRVPVVLVFFFFFFLS
ncbi:hypothetical protein R5R35_004928 [Gryllus longicercus]|uniref:Uncharacterized protein n=1 Tax=Gryllus longicercus TaxID=2509291 RepID=A0AAN9V721_9ORTH